MLSKVYLFLMVIALTIFSAQVTFSKEVPFTLEDKERLIRIETKLQEMDKRFEQIDKRFEQIDKRIDQVDKLMDQLQIFLWILSGIFTSLVVAVIGFAFWDRRTMLREARREFAEYMEKESTLRRIHEALKYMAQNNASLGEALKKFNLL